MFDLKSETMMFEKSEKKMMVFFSLFSLDSDGCLSLNFHIFLYIYVWSNKVWKQFFGNYQCRLQA